MRNFECFDEYKDDDDGQNAIADNEQIRLHHFYLTSFDIHNNSFMTISVMDASAFTPSSCLFM